MTEEKEEQIMDMHTLVVDSNETSKGYGRAFASYYEEYALSKGCHYLRIDTNEKNIRARQFYKELGDKEIAIVPCEFNGIPNVKLVLLEKCLKHAVSEKMDIAKERGYSEIAFVTDSKEADYKLEYYTPTDEVPLCGHATIAAFSLLYHRGELTKPAYTIETKAEI